MSIQFHPGESVYQISGSYAFWQTDRHTYSVFFYLYIQIYKKFNFPSWLSVIPQWHSLLYTLCHKYSLSFTVNLHLSFGEKYVLWAVLSRARMTWNSACLFCNQSLGRKQTFQMIFLLEENWLDMRWCIAFSTTFNSDIWQQNLPQHWIYIPRYVDSLKAVQHHNERTFVG